MTLLAVLESGDCITYRWLTAPWITTRGNARRLADR